MNVLQVSPFIGSPSTSGGEQRIHGLMQGRSSSDQAVRIVFDTYDRIGVEQIRSIENRVFDDNYSEYRIKNFSKSALNYLTSISGRSDLSHLWMALCPDLMKTYQSKRLTKQLDWSDAVIVEFPWQFRYIDNLSDENAPIVYSSHNVETEYHNFLDDTILGRRLLRRFKSLEEEAVRNADLVVTTTERDRDQYEDLYNSDSDFHVAPNSTFRSDIRYPKYPQYNNLSEKDCVTVLFLGTDHPPNVSGVNNILSFADQVTGNVQFRIVGSVQNAFVNKPIPDNVRFDGYVENLNPVFESSDIALNPVTVGSGSNVKLPEYLGKGIPVLTTPFGARGIPAEHGTHMLIAPIEEFPKTIQEMISGSYDLDRLVSNSIELVEESLNWTTTSVPIWNWLREHSS